MVNIETGIVEDPEVDNRLDTLEAQLKDIKTTLEKQDEERTALRKDVTDVVELLKEFRFVVKFIMKLAVFIKWFAALTIAVVAIWGTLNGIHQNKLPIIGD